MLASEPRDNVTFESNQCARLVRMSAKQCAIDARCSLRGNVLSELQPYVGQRVGDSEGFAGPRIALDFEAGLQGRLTHTGHRSPSPS